MIKKFDSFINEMASGIPLLDNNGKIKTILKEDDHDAITFAEYNDEIYVLKNIPFKRTFRHDDLLYEVEKKLGKKYYFQGKHATDVFTNRGRIWIDRKVIGIWPNNVDMKRREIKSFVLRLEKAANIKIWNNGYMISIDRGYEDFNRLRYKMEWGQKLVPLEEYALGEDTTHKIDVENKDLVNEIYTQLKDPGKHMPSILFVNGSRPLLKDDGGLVVNRRNQDTSNILSQFGEYVIYANAYWRGGEMVFDDMIEIIENNNIKAIVGNSAGGYVSFQLSNKYKIPAMSINPAMASTSEAPTLQPSPFENEPLFPKQLVVAGEKDTKVNFGVDMHLVIEDLKKMNFEEKGGTIVMLPDTAHRISPAQFNTTFRQFYKKYVQ